MLGHRNLTDVHVSPCLQNQEIIRTFPDGFNLDEHVTTLRSCNSFPVMFVEDTRLAVVMCEEMIHYFDTNKLVIVVHKNINSNIPSSCCSGVLLFRCCSALMLCCLIAYYFVACCFDAVLY